MPFEIRVRPKYHTGAWAWNYRESCWIDRSRHDGTGTIYETEAAALADLPAARADWETGGGMEQVNVEGWEIDEEAE